MNQTAFEVPAAVVTVTWTRPPPAGAAGATAEHDVWLEQDVEATWPPKWASTWPSELKRLLPLIWTRWPAGPVEGVSDTMVGPFGEAVAGVEEVVPLAPPPAGGVEPPAEADEEGWTARWMV